jgi:hypothetical protein
MDTDVDDKIVAAPAPAATPAPAPQPAQGAALTRDELIKRAIAAAETAPPEGIVPLVRLGTPVNEPPAQQRIPPQAQAQAQAQAIYNAGVDKGMQTGLAIGLSAALVLFGGYKLYLWTTSCPKVPLAKPPKNPID